MGVTDRLAAWLLGEQPVRSSELRRYWDSFTFNGNNYPLGLNQTLIGDREQIIGNLAGFTDGAYKANAIVFACMQVRLEAFSEARFLYRRFVKGRPGDVFGDKSLAILEHPWQGGVTGDLLARCIQFADLGGNAFVVRRPTQLAVLRPDWVSIIYDSPGTPENLWDVDARVVGYQYLEGGPASGADPEYFLAEEVGHFAPIPDPLFRFRGMSWLTPLIRDISSDSAATVHKLKYYENGATPNMVVKLADDVNSGNYEEWVEKLRRKESKGESAYRTMYITSSMDATVVGSNMKDVDFAHVQAAGETRIAAAAGTPPVLVGLSEGLTGSSLNTGNYSAARRRFADLTIRPLWRNFVGSMETIIPPPTGTQLWYDDRDIAFLREDRKDQAEIQSMEAQTARTLVDAGWEAETVVAAIANQDWSLLKHTGLFSVQLQAPGSTKMPQGEVPGEKPVSGGGGPAVPAGPVAKPTPPRKRAADQLEALTRGSAHD